MHGFRATSGLPSCTESVHVQKVCHAPKPCKLTTRCDLHHARVGVQHNSPQPCTPAVQGTLHGFRAIQDNHYRTTKPVMHCVQDGRSIYRNSITPTVVLPDHQRNHRTRAQTVGAR